MRQLFTAILLLLFSLHLFSQQLIKGKVSDEQGHAIQGAKITLQGTKTTKTTNQDGQFEINSQSSKPATLLITHIGYTPQSVTVIPGSPVAISLKSSSVSINEITVTSLRATDKSPVAYTNIDKETISRSNLGQDIPYLLAQTPSFITTSDAGTGIGYTGFRIRGTDGNRTNITVNGVPLNDAESHGTFFVNMPDFSSSLSSFQVQRGVGTSTNGAAAFGASINMQTETLNPEAYGEISTTVGSFNTNKNTLKAGTGIINKHFALDARLSNITSDGYIDRASVNLKSYFFSAGYYGEKTSLKFITFGGKEKTYQAWNGVDSEIMKSNRTYNELGSYIDNNGNTQYYNNQTDNYTQLHYQLHWLQEFNPCLHLNATAHYTRGYGYYEEYKKNRSFTEYGMTPDTIVGSARATTDLVRQKWLDNYFYGLTFALNYNLTTSTDLTLGGAANRYDGNHFGKVIWARYANNLDINKDWYRSTSQKDDANIYLKMNTELFNGLFANIDMQYRHIAYSMDGTDDKFDASTGKMRNITTKQPYTFNFFNPKIGATYKINTQNSLFASYSVANREPNRTNYTERSDTAALPTNETLYDTEFGYQYQTQGFSAGINLYYMKYKNQLILTGKMSDIGEPLSTNISNSYRTGIELTVGKKICNFLNWTGNATFSQNKILNFTEEGVDEYDANWNWIGSRNNKLGTTDIAYSPNLIANSIFTLNIKQFEALFSSSYVGKQYFDNTSSNDRAIDAYFVNNLTLKYSIPTKLLKGFDIRLMVNNLFNEQYENNAWTWYSYYLDGKRVNEKRYFPQAGINFLTSITLKF